MPCRDHAGRAHVTHSHYDLLEVCDALHIAFAFSCVALRSVALRCVLLYCVALHCA